MAYQFIKRWISWLTIANIVESVKKSDDVSVSGFAPMQWNFTNFVNSSNNVYVANRSFPYNQNVCLDGVDYSSCRLSKSLSYTGY